MIKATYNKDTFKVRLSDESIVDVYLYGGNPTIKKICRELGTADFDVLAHYPERVTGLVSDEDFLSAAINLGYVNQPAYHSNELISRTLQVKHWVYVHGEDIETLHVYMPVTCEVFPYTDCTPVSMNVEKILMYVPIWIYDSMAYSSVSTHCDPSALLPNFSLVTVHFKDGSSNNTIVSRVDDAIRSSNVLLTNHGFIDYIEIITYLGKQKYDRIVKVRGASVSHPQDGREK